MCFCLIDGLFCLSTSVSVSWSANLAKGRKQQKIGAAWMATKRAWISEKWQETGQYTNPNTKY